MAELPTYQINAGVYPRVISSGCYILLLFSNPHGSGVNFPIVFMTTRFFWVSFFSTFSSFKLPGPAPLSPRPGRSPPWGPPRWLKLEGSWRIRESYWTKGNSPKIWRCPKFAGWFISWKIPWKEMDKMPGALWLRKPPYGLSSGEILGGSSRLVRGFPWVTREDPPPFGSRVLDASGEKTLVSDR